LRLVVDATPHPFYPRERDPVPILQHCTGGCAGLGTGMDRKEIFRPRRGSMPGQFSQ